MFSSSKLFWSVLGLRGCGTPGSRGSAGTRRKISRRMWRPSGAIRPGHFGPTTGERPQSIGGWRRGLAASAVGLSRPRRRGPFRRRLLRARPFTLVSPAGRNVARWSFGSLPSSAIACWTRPFVAEKYRVFQPGGTAASSAATAMFGKGGRVRGVCSSRPCRRAPGGGKVPVEDTDTAGDGEVPHPVPEAMARRTTRMKPARMKSDQNAFNPISSRAGFNPRRPAGGFISSPAQSPRFATSPPFSAASGDPRLPACSPYTYRHHRRAGPHQDALDPAPAVFSPNRRATVVHQVETPHTAPARYSWNRRLPASPHGSCLRRSTDPANYASTNASPHARHEGERPAPACHSR